MGGDRLRDEGTALSVDAYPNAIEAFNVIGAEVLTEAQRRDLITFNDGQLRDALDTLNEIAQKIGDDEQDPLYDKLGFLVEVHQMDEFKHTFSFGIEAVFRDGKFSIWWPQ